MRKWVGLLTWDICIVSSSTQAWIKISHASQCRSCKIASLTRWLMKIVFSIIYFVFFSFSNSYSYRDNHIAHYFGKPVSKITQTNLDNWSILYVPETEHWDAPLEMLHKHLCYTLYTHNVVSFVDSCMLWLYCKPHDCWLVMLHLCLKFT